MDNKELAGMTGQAGSEKVASYKLNEIRMTGDSGEFSLLELLGEKTEGKYPVIDVGKGLEGVILKMRWRLFKYEEIPDSKAPGGVRVNITATSEYDNKSADRVVVFNTGEKGIAADIKQKYGLGSQRVLYFYLPGRKEVVRVIVKPSALSGDKNPGGEMGLFEYVDLFNDEGLYLHEWTTKLGSVFRKDPNGNKRKDYFAMTFAKGHEIIPENKAHMVEMVKEVHKKTSGNPEFADQWAPPNSPKGTEDIEYPAEDINPDDIPF
jgi:hypothetical protein